MGAEFDFDKHVLIIHGQAETAPRLAKPVSLAFEKAFYASSLSDKNFRQTKIIDPEFLQDFFRQKGISENDGRIILPLVNSITYDRPKNHHTISCGSAVLAIIKVGTK